MFVIAEDRIEEREFYYLPSSRLQWQPAASGPGEVRRLYVDPLDSIEARLVRFPAGSVTGGAPELLGPEVYVVSGEFEADGVPLNEGDFHRAVGASVCGRTETGCILFTLRECCASAGTGDAPDVGTMANAATIRVTEGRWTHTGVGTHYKRLAHDPVRHVDVSLVQMDRGAIYPAHSFAGSEELLVVRGECLCEGQRLGPGDYFHSIAGAIHRPTASESGCQYILVRHGTPD